MRVIAFAVLLSVVACNGTKESTEPAPAADISQDPICGMAVGKEEAKFTAAFEGREIFFCSPACKGKFEKNPGPFSMGYCNCRVDMPKCRCGHCKELKAGINPTETCPCHEENEEKGKKHDHDHDH